MSPPASSIGPPRDPKDARTLRSLPSRTRTAPLSAAPPVCSSLRSLSGSAAGTAPADARHADPGKDHRQDQHPRIGHRRQDRVAADLLDCMVLATDDVIQPGALVRRAASAPRTDVRSGRTARVTPISAVGMPSPTNIHCQPCRPHSAVHLQQSSRNWRRRSRSPAAIRSGTSRRRGRGAVAETSGENTAAARETALPPPRLSARER